MRQIKVVVTSPTWSLNGVNTFSATLVRGLRDAGMDARILLTGITHEDDKPLPLPDDIPFDRLVLPTFASWPARWHALRAYLESRAPCIYLPNHDVRHSCVSPALSARVGIIGIAHSDDPQHYDHVRRLWTAWNAVVAVSETIAGNLRRSNDGLASRLTMIPYGVAVPGALAPRENGGACLRILYSGRLEQSQKRVLDLAVIAGGLMKRGVVFELTIAGDGPERGSLAREIAALGLDARVRMLGTVTNEATMRLCEASDVYLLPSRFEGLPLGVLEAMSRGCVPVVSDVDSGIPSLIRDGVNGYRVPVGSLTSFVDRLSGLASSAPLRRTMGDEARRTILSEGYRAEDMVARYMTLIDAVSSQVRKEQFVRTGGRVVAPGEMTWRERLNAPLFPLVRRWRRGA